MGNKVVVALLAIVVMLLVAVLVVGVLFLSRDTRSKATQLREADYDRCVARVEAQINAWVDWRKSVPDPTVVEELSGKAEQRLYGELDILNGYVEFVFVGSNKEGNLRVPAAQRRSLHKYCRPVLK